MAAHELPRNRTVATCDPFGDSSTFYAWSSFTEARQVVARDFAPDAAWLPIRLGD
jgi:hypothetical protein